MKNHFEMMLKPFKVPKGLPNKLPRDDKKEKLLEKTLQIFRNLFERPSNLFNFLLIPEENPECPSLTSTWSPKLLSLKPTSLSRIPTMSACPVLH